MVRLFVAGGPYMFLLTALALVVLVLSAKKLFELFARDERDPQRLSLGVDAILFWGCISAVLGFLGQFTGSYISLMIIRRSPVVDPARVAEGIAVSLISTVFGLTIFMISSLVWFGLRWRLGQLIARSERRLV